MDRLQALEVVVAVAETGSFSKAALALGMSRAATSAKVKEVEEVLGTRLFQRTTRRVKLTLDGEQFVGRARSLLDEGEALMGSFAGEKGPLKGRVRVDMSESLARDVVIPALGGFLEAHPGVALEVSSTDRMVDVVGEGFDLVIRSGSLAESSLVARRLGAYRALNCVSRDYARTRGVPQTLDDLSAHLLVHYVARFGGGRDGFEYQGDGGEMRRVEMRASITVNSASAYMAACSAGLGIVQCPEVSARAQLDTGELIEILPRYHPPALSVSLLFPTRRHTPRRVRVFADWIAALVQPRLMAQG
jgi:DNA-binding transcriptional LysR family regulator